MKLLIATSGSSLTAPVARRFEKATWYLLVDTDTRVVKKHRNAKPGLHHDIVANAADEGAVCVLAERFGETAIRQLANHEMKVGCVRHCTAAAAMGKIEEGKIKPEKARTILMRNEILNRFRQQQRGAVTRPSRAHGMAAGTRVQHHLQQYAGRGH
jgi:predicted Fe-Mo cluster-binding NifX family protein